MFAVLSENFFAPLASPNKTVYWECICKLFAVMDNQLSFGVERELLTEELQYYFDQNHAASILDEEISDKDSRSKAGWMLRRLEHYGWIEIETDKSYVQRVNFKEHAVKIIKTLTEISEGKRTEYQGYIYTIYSLVRGRTENPGIVLLQILENTDMLITGLKNLNSNIKHYIDNLTKYKSIAEIMDALFNDYITNIVDRAYHRLRTSDNVSKFRPEIIERLESYSRSKAYIGRAKRELAEIKDITEDEAEELVYQYIRQIIDAFFNMDDILHEIDRKNTQYQRAAINRAKFLLTGSEDVRGQLKELLIGINEKMNEEDMAFGGIYRIDFLEHLIGLYSVSVIDEASLYKPIEGKRSFKPESMQMKEPSSAFKRQKLQAMVEKMQRILTPERINAYVLAQLGNAQQVKASMLPLKDVDDFVKLIYVRLYGQRQNMGYQIELANEIEVNGYEFRDFTIRKKER